MHLRDHTTKTCPFCRSKDTLYKYDSGTTFHCFACGAHGGEVAFLMMTEGIPLQEAIAKTQAPN